MKNILFFDTETTGLPVNHNASYTDVDNWPRLVQLAWQQYRGEVLGVEGVAIIHPVGFSIPEASSRIHGITDAQAVLKGRWIDNVLIPFLHAARQSDLIVAHNYTFDFPVVAAEMVRLGMSVDELESLPWYCTKEQSTDLCKIPNTSPYRGQYKWPSLDELHQFLFSQPITGREQFHDAMIDVRATARCYFEMQRRTW